MATINVCNTQIVPIALSNVTYTKQPAVSAYANTQSNVTGDGTSYTILYANELIDKQNNFSSPTWTAPVTGVYHISFIVYLQQLGAGNTTMAGGIAVTGNTYENIALSAAAIRDANNNWASCETSALARLTAGDTAYSYFTVAGGTKIVDINGSIQQTLFSARLVA
jgi:hypothetical protein